MWEEGFTFLLPNPENDTLSLRVVDKKTDTELGQLSLKMKSLCNKNCFEIIKEPFSLMRSGPESKVILSLRLRVSIFGCIEIKTSLIFWQLSDFKNAR